MKLLRYPHILQAKYNKTCCCIGDWLVVGGLKKLQVFSISKLVDGALGKISLREVSPDFEVKIPEVLETIYCIVGDQKKLFLGTDTGVFTIEDWLDSKLSNNVSKKMFELSAPSTITDLKFDSTTGVIFVLVNFSAERNAVLLFKPDAGLQIGEIPLGQTKPLTGIVDPTGQIFTVSCSDRHLYVFQYNEKGANKLLQKLPQYVQIDPIHYKIAMSPQAHLLPIVNSLNGTTPAIALLAANNDFKVETTLVGHMDKCKVLKFSPQIYEKPAKDGSKAVYNLLATSGTGNQNVVVWNTKRTKPLLNTNALSSSFVNDIEWSHDGQALFAVTDDGYLFIFAFRETELGQVSPEKDVVAMRSARKILEPLPDNVGPEPATRVKDELNLSTAVASVSKVNGKKKIAPTTIQSTSMEFNGPSYSVPKDLKRKPKGSQQGPTNKKQKHDLEPMDFLDTNLIMPTISFSKVRLASPKVRLSFQYSPSHDSNFIFSVKNGTGNDQKPTVITLEVKDGAQTKILFEDFMPKFVTMCVEGESFWSCCSDDGVVYVYSDSGKKILPPLITGTPCSFLEAAGKFLMCVTSMGELYCWNIEACKLEFPVTSIYPLLSPSLRFSDDVLTRAENITMCAVTRAGVPIVTLSNGDGFMFDKDMETWMLINDSWWAYGSQYWDATKTSAGTSMGPYNEKEDKKNNSWNMEAKALISELESDEASIINFLERKTNDELHRKGRVRNLQKFSKTILIKEGFENLEEVVTLSHLENKLLVLLKLQEDAEFVKLLIVYCIRLSELGYTQRLSDVMEWLYGDGNYKDKIIGGKTAEDLLKKISIACASIRHVQRVTTSFATAIGMISDGI
ncbi:LAMI_0E12992g1_1 [Lachancea mirantina]|uniref:Protein HIR n=1 Tax=Lachancea mirantina TaxID=1230905 RepID=A0A1G4JQK5_9SACH|nr:LAMI_0E12992g1_1 [Lachancea mirantina]